MKWASPNKFDVIYETTVATSAVKCSSGWHMMINSIHFEGWIYVSIMPCAEVVFHNMSQQMAGKDKHRGCCRSFKHGHQFTNSICCQPPITAHMTARERRARFMSSKCRRFPEEWALENTLPLRAQRCQRRCRIKVTLWVNNHLPAHQQCMAAGNSICPSAKEWISPLLSIQMAYTYVACFFIVFFFLTSE